MNVKFDAQVSTACSGITFGAKPSSPADAMMDSIMNQRRSDKPLAKLTQDQNTGNYIVSLIPFIAPWIVLFVFSIIGL